MNLANAKIPETSARESEIVPEAKNRETRGEIVAMPKPLTETTAAQGGIDAVEPFLQKLAAPSIAEIEELISELQAARNYLQSERDRLEREMDRYVHLNDTASASVKVISDGLGQWRKASNAMRGARPDR